MKGHSRLAGPLAIAIIVSVLVGLGSGWYLCSLLSDSLPLMAGKAVLESLADSLSTKGVIDEFLEQQASLGSAADDFVDIIKQKEDAIRDLKGQLNEATTETEQAHEAVLEAAQDDEQASAKLANLTAEQMEPCMVPLGVIAAKDLHIAALVNENGLLENWAQRSNELLLAEEHQSGLWEQAYGKQKERADLGVETINKLRKRRVRVRPGAFVGGGKSINNQHGWTPVYGFGITLTYGRS